MLLLVFVAIGAPILPLWLRQRARERLASNERLVASMVKVLASVQADFRGNDRDGNGVLDFWTGDLAGLHAYGLIDRDLALADLRPLVPLVPEPIPWNGYYFMALDEDRSVEPPEPYRNNGPRNPGRFGFMAIPAEYGLTGRTTVIINEGNSLWGWSDERPEVRYWPSDQERRTRCRRVG